MAVVDLSPKFKLLTAEKEIVLPISFRDDVDFGSGKPEERATRSKTFYSNSAPTGDYKPGDIWVDTDDDNHIYRADEDFDWVSIRDAGAGSVQTTIFYQATAPSSGMVTGDLWIDSDDNKVYRYSGAAWGEVQDDDIATALTNAASAQSTADSKIVVFRQTGVPTATDAGDLWFDSDDGDKCYRATAEGDNEVKAGEWIRVDVGANPTLIDVLAATNAPAEANADVTGDNVPLYADIVAPSGGAITYNIQDKGMFSFGDGSDADYVLDASQAAVGGLFGKSGTIFTLLRDGYFTDLTIADGYTLKPNGYRIFCTGTLTVGGGTSGIISRDGNDGGDGVVGEVGNTAHNAGGASGAALADGYLKGSLAGAEGGDGGDGADENGDAGVATTNSIGSSGVAGGNGGATNAGDQGSGGSAGAATASLVQLIANWHLATLLDISATGATLKFDNSASSGGGGCGGSSNDFPGGGVGGTGGGASSGGGIIAIYAKIIIVNAGGLISANGGTGGNGGNGANGGAWEGTGGGGGGAGGNGGQLILVYNSLTNSGSITVTAGTKGTGGTGGTGTPAAANGADGTDGAIGTIRQFSISL